MDEIVMDAVAQHARKVEWQKDQEKVPQAAGISDSLYRSQKDTESFIPRSPGDTQKQAPSDPPQSVIW